MAKLLLFKHICKNRCTFVSDLLQIEFYLRFYYENMYQPLRFLLTALLVAGVVFCAEKNILTERTPCYAMGRGADRHNIA